MPRHDTECLPGVLHLGVLNLFREADNSVHITVAMADGAMIEFRAKPDLNEAMKPIDYIEALIVEAAENMKARAA